MVQQAIEAPPSETDSPAPSVDPASPPAPPASAGDSLEAPVAASPEAAAPAPDAEGAPAESQEPVPPLPSPAETFAAGLSDAEAQTLLKHERFQGPLKQQRENAVKQREAELRRLAGSSAHVQATLQQAVQAIRMAETEDQAQAAAAGAQVVLQSNTAYTLSEVLQRLPDAILAGHEITPEVQREAMRLFHEGSGQGYDGYLKTLFDGAVQQGTGKSLAGMSMEDAIKSVPSDSPFARSVTRWKASEMTAMDRERQPGVTGAPPTPQGGTAPAQGNGPTPAQYRAATPAQRTKWNTDGVEVDLSGV